MYKKIILSLMLLPLFSSNQSLCSSNDPSEPINQLITFVMTQIGENSYYIYTQIEENTREHRVELFKQIETHNEKIVQGVIYVGSIVILQTGNVIYNWRYPKKENIAHEAEADVRIKEAQERSEFLDAKANFSKCLKSINKDAEKNAVGIPTVCETKARDLILCDGEAAVILMMKNFNK